MLKKSALFAACLVAGTMCSAYAAPTQYQFTFDVPSISNYASNSTVQSYLQSILPGTTVTGSAGLKNSQYTGEGYVVGPKLNGSTTPTPLTLGNTTGYYPGASLNGTLDSILGGPSTDGYIVNYGTNNQGKPFDRITMTFPIRIYGISFDYEIFPDGTCPSFSSRCTPTTSNWPDFEFYADGISKLVTLGVLPGDSSTYPNSPNHPNTNSKEPAPQYLGSSGFIQLDGVTKLEFVDWPQRIGIDDLTVTTTPEPATLSLVGLALAGLALRRRKRTG